LLDSFLTGTFDPGRYPKSEAAKIFCSRNPAMRTKILNTAEEDPEIAEPVDSADSGREGRAQSLLP
jgi:hypothetical protein